MKAKANGCQSYDKSSLMESAIGEVITLLKRCHVLVRSKLPALPKNSARLSQGLVHKLNTSFTPDVFFFKKIIFIFKVSMLILLTFP